MVVPTCKPSGGEFTSRFNAASRSVHVHVLLLLVLLLLKGASKWKLCGALQFSWFEWFASQLYIYVNIYMVWL